MSYATLNFQVLGNVAQIVEINLEPGASLIADGGAVLYADEEIVFALRDDDGVADAQENASPPAEDNEDDFVPASPQWEWNAPSALKDVLAEPSPAEDEEREAGLLEKLWTATRKSVGKIGSKLLAPKKQTHEAPPTTDHSTALPSGSEGFDWEGGAALDDEPREDKEPLPDAQAGKDFSWYLTQCTNQSDYLRKIALGTAAPGGSIMAIDLNALAENSLVIQTGAFVCARFGTRLQQFRNTSIALRFAPEKMLSFDMVQGDDYVLLRMEGNVIQKEMIQDAININLHSLVAFETSLELETDRPQYLTAMHHEYALPLGRLSGTGRYWLQTTHLPNLLYRAAPYLLMPTEDNHYDSATQMKESNPDSLASKAALFDDGLDEAGREVSEE